MAAPGAASRRRLLKAAPKSGPQKRLPRSGSRCKKVAPEPPRRFVACRVVSCVRKCVNLLPGAAQGAAKVWWLPGQLLGGGSQGKGSRGGPRPQRRSLGTPQCGQSFLTVVGCFQSLWWMGEFLRRIFVICGISWPWEYTIFMTI